MLRVNVSGLQHHNIGNIRGELVRYSRWSLNICQRFFKMAIFPQDESKDSTQKMEQIVFRL